MVLTAFYIQTFISALIAGVSFYRFSERDTGIRLIGIIFFLSFFFNCLQFVALKLRLPFINQVGTIYLFVSIVANTIWYDHAFARRYRKRLIALSSLTIVWGLAVVFFVHDPGETTTLLGLAMSFLGLVYSILFFYRLMQELPTIHLHHLPSFWFNSAFLIYASGTFFLFAAYDYLVRVTSSFWVFNICVYILHQLIVFIGLYYDRRALEKMASSKSDKVDKQFLQK